MRQIFRVSTKDIIIGTFLSTYFHKIFISELVVLRPERKWSSFNFWGMMSLMFHSKFFFYEKRSQLHKLNIQFRKKKHRSWVGKQTWSARFKIHMCLSHEQLSNNTIDLETHIFSSDMDWPKKSYNAVIIRNVTHNHQDLSLQMVYVSLVWTLPTPSTHHKIAFRFFPRVPVGPFTVSPYERTRRSLRSLSVWARPVGDGGRRGSPRPGVTGSLPGLCRPTLRQLCRWGSSWPPPPPLPTLHSA